MKVHIHANCQAVPLAGMLHEVEPDWDISYFEVHADKIIENIDDHRRHIRTADLVLTQPIHRNFRGRDDLSVDWIRENVRKDATLLVFPSMHFGAHHPGLDGLPLAGLPFLSSLLAAQLVASGESPATATGRLLSDDLLSEAEVETEIQVSLNEMKRREFDDRMDVVISPFFEENCRARVMFHIQNHPLREAMVFIANQILDNVGRRARIPIEGRDYQPDVHVPPLPAVARYLRNRGGCLSEAEAAERVLLPGYPVMTQEEYYGRMTEALAQYTPGEIYGVMEKCWPTVQILRRLAEQDSAIPGIERWL